MSDYQHMLGKCRAAAMGGREAWVVMSTGERLLVAMVLNRSDWLVAMDYTIAEALRRLEGEWAQSIPRLERELDNDGLLAAGQR